MSTELKALIKGTGPQFAGVLNNWQTHWIDVTDDLSQARVLIQSWRDHSGTISGERPDQWHAIVTADWPVAKVQIVVGDVEDEHDGIPWWQFLGLAAAEVVQR